MKQAVKLCRLTLCACLAWLIWAPSATFASDPVCALPETTPAPQVKSSYPACPAGPNFQAMGDYMEFCNMNGGWRGCVYWYTYNGRCDMFGETYEYFTCHCGSDYGREDCFWTQPCGHPAQ